MKLAFGTWNMACQFAGRVSRNVFDDAMYAARCLGELFQSRGLVTCSPFNHGLVASPVKGPCDVGESDMADTCGDRCLAISLNFHFI